MKENSRPLWPGCTTRITSPAMKAQPSRSPISIVLPPSITGAYCRLCRVEGLATRMVNGADVAELLRTIATPPFDKTAFLNATSAVASGRFATCKRFRASVASASILAWAWAVVSCTLALACSLAACTFAAASASVFFAAASAVATFSAAAASALVNLCSASLRFDSASAIDWISLAFNDAIWPSF